LGEEKIQDRNDSRQDRQDRQGNPKSESSEFISSEFFLAILAVLARDFLGQVGASAA
jgi:hypothetical protein